MDKTIKEQILEINKLDLSLEDKNKKIQKLYIQNSNSKMILLKQS